VAPAALAVLAVAVVALGTSPLWSSSARFLLSGRSFVAPDPAVHPSKWEGREITEAIAYALLNGLEGNPRLAYDPVAIARNVPDVRHSFPWPEHARGEVTFVNDARGFRRLPEEDATGAEATVLVLGDSHTYGLVDNDETFTALLEHRLNASGAAGRVAVLNGAVAGTGPYEYLGSLQLRLAELLPDLVVVVFFTGNDFLNALRIDAFLNKVSPPPGDKAAQQRFTEAREHWRSQLAQGFGQAQQFTLHPAQGAYAVTVCRDVFLRMDALCRERGSRLLVVMLPCKTAVDGDDEETVAKLLATLALERRDLEINRRLGEALAVSLTAAGVEAVDLHEALRGDPHPLYWRDDHHLNVAGHERMAGALLPLVAARLGRTH